MIGILQLKAHLSPFSLVILKYLGMNISARKSEIIYLNYTPFTKTTEDD